MLKIVRNVNEFQHFDGEKTSTVSATWRKALLVMAEQSVQLNQQANHTYGVVSFKG